MNKELSNKARAGKLKVVLVTLGAILTVVGAQKLGELYSLNTPQYKVGQCFKDHAEIEGTPVDVVVEITAVEGKRFKQTYAFEGALLLPLGEGMVFPLPVAGKVSVKEFQLMKKKTGSPTLINCETGESLEK